MESPNKHLIDPLLADAAARICRKTTPFGYWLGKTFFKAELSSILYMAYAYFRWLDDVVDQPNISRDLASRLADRQRSLVRAWYGGNNPSPSGQPETLLRAVIEYDRETGCQLRHMISSFLAALTWDVRRRYTVVSQRDLDRYSLYLGQAYAEGLLFGLGLNPVHPRYCGPRDLCGTAAHLAHILRDLMADLELGYINISSEDIERFYIDVADPRLPGVGQWVRFTVERARILFLQGRNQRDALPSPRARLVFDITCLRYLRTLDRIKEKWLHWDTFQGIE